MQTIIHVVWILKSIIIVTNPNSQAFGHNIDKPYIIIRLMEAIAMPLWILWKLRKGSHQQIISNIELTNNPGDVADQHNRERTAREAAAL